MKTSTFPILLTLTLLLAACGSGENGQPAETDTYSTAITDDGLSFASLGEAVDSLSLPAGTQTREELITEGGYQWRMITAFLPNGEKAVIEGDFVDEGDPTGKLPGSRVNRILVDGPEFVTQGGIQVGMNLDDLKAIYPDTSLQAIFLADYDIVDVRPVGIGRLHFNFNDTDGQAAEAAGGKDALIPLSAISENSTIVSIVISY